jgi:hypothetical protein
VIRLTRSPWSWQAITAAGATIITFSDGEQAARWVEDEAHKWPGARVERVRVTTTTETVFEQPMERAA